MPGKQNMKFQVPVLFLVFNRPDTTEKVFQRIREMKPAKLFIAADGLRPGKAGDKEKCEEVRDLILKGIDWRCEVKTLFRNSNLGCGHAVSGAINWFFENVEEGIIIEDDTLPDLSFFNFCRELLEKYRHDKKVKMISGNNFQNGNWRGDGSYYFSAYSHIWGWATWRRAWKEYDFALSKQNDATLLKALDHYFSDNNIKGHWMEVFHRVKTGMIDTWDLQLLFCIWDKRGVNIIPNINLVTNIGFGNSATHTANRKDKLAGIPYSAIEKTTHPKDISINKEADAFTFYEFYYPGKTFFIKFIDKLKKGIFSSK